MQTDEYIFFDRVRRFLDNRETYDEFLKLINLFTQGFIDGRTLLIRAEDFLGNSEHMAKFRDILGIEVRDPVPDVTASVTRLRWDHNIKAVMNMGYKSAYKKLAPGAVCSTPFLPLPPRTDFFAGGGLLLRTRLTLQLSPQ
jgi:hypothetical protein